MKTPVLGKKGGIDLVKENGPIPSNRKLFLKNVEIPVLVWLETSCGEFKSQ